MQRTSLANVYLVGLLLILVAQGASAEVLSWEVDGKTREAIVYAPAGSRDDERVPVVLAFHGRGDNMQNFQHTNVHMAWPEAIVVYFRGFRLAAVSPVGRWSATMTSTAT